MESNTDLFLEGAKYYVTENYKEAVKSFTLFLNIHYDKYESYLYRASAYIKLGNYPDALADLEYAETKCQTSFDLYYKMSIVYFHLEKYLESNDNLKKALNLSTHAEQREKITILSNKLEIELEENGLLIHANPTTNTIGQIQPNLKFISNWYQTPTYIILILDSNTNLSKDDYDFSIEKKNLKITDKKSGLVVWEMDLSNSCLPEQSSSESHGKKLEFKIKKEIDNFNWVTIERAKLGEQQSNFKPSYPTSSQVKKDWDNVEKEVSDELAADAKADPNEGMMRLFKDIYGKGDEATRRAMMKSFQTSGGTVLSTNWGEVAEKDYDGKDRPDAPKGQEWRKNE